MSKLLAERLFPGGSARGRHIRSGSEPETRDLEIVGIAADARLEDPVLLAIAGAAALIPVHRASSVDPMITLRYE